tara:strand:- start:168 stop:392 length:225 start_codon:yes stop_codon:yes gene_type:complete
MYRFINLYYYSSINFSMILRYQFSNSLTFLSSCFSKFLSFPGFAAQCPKGEFTGLKEEREINLFSNLLSSVLKI